VVAVVAVVAMIATIIDVFDLSSNDISNLFEKNFITIMIYINY